mgnify:CR=1 FL=1
MIVLGERVIGVIDLHINIDHEVAELGYGMDSAHWGKGLMPEATRSVLDWCFGERRLAKRFTQGWAPVTHGP